MKDEYYKKVVIESEKDLPEDGNYLCHIIEGCVENCIIKRSNGHKAYKPKWWIDNIDWYLLPVNQEQSVQVIDKEWIFEIIDKTNKFAKQLITDHFDRHRDQLKPVDLRDELINFTKYFRHGLTEEDVDDYLKDQIEAEVKQEQIEADAMRALHHASEKVGKKERDPMRDLHCAIEKSVKFINEQGIYSDTYTTECDGEDEPGNVITDKGIYFDDEN